MFQPTTSRLARSEQQRSRRRECVQVNAGVVSFTQDDEEAQQKANMRFRQQKPHMCEGKRRQNPSSCMNVAVTHEPYYDMVYACGHIYGLQTSCKVSLISDNLSVYKSVNDDFHVDMLIVTVVSDTWCPAKRLLLVANLCTSQAR